MQKTMSDGRRKTVLYAPEVINMDVLSVMQDKDLATRHRDIDEERVLAQEMGYSTLQWEVELAYIKREQQIRNERRQAHAEITAREYEEFYASEAALPSGDDDNSAFVFAATGGKPKWN